MIAPILIALLLASVAQARRLPAPKLQAPAAGGHVESLPTFAWGAVAGAATYEFQLSADPRFGSLVVTQLGKGSISTPNTAATIEKAVPDGTYYWRVRAVSAKNSSGPWSARRGLVKAWTAAPSVIGPELTTIAWPTQPVVFQWSTVPHAVKYRLVVATDPELAHQVIGSATKPLDTQGTVYTPSVPLPPGTYFWAVTPLDAQGHSGTRSPLAEFSDEWPSSTIASLQDLNPDPRVFDPLFTWSPVAGAAKYEVEVNSAKEFPVGSKWCCSNPTIGTSLAPEHVLANNAYYWRVRAVDPKGNAGVWNYYDNGVGCSSPACAAPFTKAFDSVTPSVAGLRMIDASGATVPGAPATDTPIVAWERVPGASDYQVQIGHYVSPFGCDWSLGATSETASTYWTPLGVGIDEPQANWPPAQVGSLTGALTAETSYCVRVLARSDNDATHSAVTSGWTQLNGLDSPAFTFEAATPEPSKGPLVTPAAAYRLPSSGSFTSRTPLFTWQRVAGAAGYWVVVARDEAMTHVINVGFTNVPAYAPRLGSGAPYSDETTAYYWAVVPSAEANGRGVFTEPAQDSPQTFSKASVPPTPLAPAPSSVVNSQPTFRWTAAENARTYRLQVSADPSFGSTLDDVTTDATAYTSSTTYPANTVLYWRVRANDWTEQGLNWSAVQTFQRTLPAPVVSSANATGGEPIPVLGWAPAPGAIGYEIHVDKIDGTGLNFNFPAPAFTPVEWYGVGVWRWQVRADFPTSSFVQPVTSSYSPSQIFVRTLNAPVGVVGTRSGRRLVIAWDPDPAAKQYDIEVSHTDGFATPIETKRTDNTSWAPRLDDTAAADRGTLYWRVAAVDGVGNVGAYATGAFRAPSRPRCTSRRRGSHRHTCPARRTRKKH